MSLIGKQVADFTVQAFQNGDEVCPAKRTPGAETLRPSLDLVGAL